MKRSLFYGTRHFWTLGLTILLAAVAVRLGFWQLARLDERREANRVELSGRSLPPLRLNAPSGIDSVLHGRRVIASGRFDPAGEIILRNRAHNQAPGVHLVTPFRLEGSDEVAWVLRGFAFAPDGMKPPKVSAADTGVVELSGIGASFPQTEDGGQPVSFDGATTYRRLDESVLLRKEPSSLKGFIYLEGDTAGVGRLPAVPPPALDEGPHFSYALQWFGIATAILIFGWVIVLRPAIGRGPAQRPSAP